MLLVVKLVSCLSFRSFHLFCLSLWYCRHDLDFFPGKIQALLATTKEQRREYKSKFVDMDVEFARMRERLETMNLILDDIQVRFFLNKLVCNRRRQSRIANQYQEFSVYLFYVLTKLAQINNCIVLWQYIHRQVRNQIL